MLIIRAYVVLLTAPLLLAILSISHYDRTRSAASWSVLARQIHSSIWPSILQTDSVTSQHVHWSITTVAYLNLGLAILGVVSGVITPLGLGDEIKPTSTQRTGFQYAPDLSFFGRGTMGRPDKPMSRDCLITAVNCPGAIVPGSVLGQGTLEPRPNPNISATTRIPQNITEMFRSATDGSTVASTLDVQYRSWVSYRNKYFDNNEPYVRGRFKHIELLLSQEQYVLVEGVIADTISGGIGYRNHSVPSGLQYGGEWEEDVLWIQPDIACVDTNLSLETVLGEPLRDSPQYGSLGLVDRGGFANLPTADPYVGWPNLTYSAPDVQDRANRTAWLSNLLTSMVLNLTDAGGWQYGLNVSVGEHYNISRSNSNLGISPHLGVNTLQISSDWLTENPAYFVDNGSLVKNGAVLYPERDYPQALAVALFGELDGLCTGQYNEASLENDYNVQCGYLLGAGSRTDGGQPLMEEAGSTWEQPLYTCAGAVKASVKTVTFSINGTLTLENLVVKRAEERVYENKDDEPLWAMEDWWYPGCEGAYSAPLWGIVDDSFEGTPGYNFTRSPSFYLPGVLVLRDVTSPEDMLAAAQAPVATVRELFWVAFARSSGGIFPTYNGDFVSSLMSRWKPLSDTTEGVVKILNLVWTDVMASATVGTNLQPSSMKRSTFSNNGQTIRAHSRHITYDIRYAIPALLTLLLWISLLLAGFVVCILDRHPFWKLRSLLNETSVGRHAAAATDSASKNLLRATSNRWLDGAGYVPLKLGDEFRSEAVQSYRTEYGQEYELKAQNAPLARPLVGEDDSLEGLQRLGPADIAVDRSPEFFRR